MNERGTDSRTGLSESVLISGLHYPVNVLGHGRRVGIWLQGCSIACPGCVSKDTWPFDERKRTTVSAVMEWVRSHAHADVDGVTISGGEPFEQPLALHALIKAIRTWFEVLRANERIAKDRDILCYSGLPWRKIRGQYEEILLNLDAVIPEPYVANLPVCNLRGSSNQNIHCLTLLGKARYGDLKSKVCRSLQVDIDEAGGLVLIGIPEKEALTLMENDLKGLEITLGGASWR